MRGMAGGLDATVSKDGKSRRWVFLFRWQGRRCEMGLGGCDAVLLARARELAARCRLEVVVRVGIHLRADRPHTKRSVAPPRSAACQHARARRPSAKVAKGLHCCQVAKVGAMLSTRSQWAMASTVYAASLRSDKRPGEITTDDVLTGLGRGSGSQSQPKHRGTRGRIEVVPKCSAKGRFHRGRRGQSRALKGHIDHSSRNSRGAAPRALEWCILTAAPLGEALGTRWREIDLDAAVLERPAERMRAKGAQSSTRAPLSPVGTLYCWSRKTRWTLSSPGSSLAESHSPEHGHQGALLAHGRASIRSHGFRSTFGDWAGEVNKLSARGLRGGTRPCCR